MIMIKIFEFLKSFFEPERKVDEENARLRLQQNFLNDHSNVTHMDEFIRRRNSKEESMYDINNGKGNAAKEKNNFNMNHSNY